MSMVEGAINNLAERIRHLETLEIEAANLPYASNIWTRAGTDIYQTNGGDDLLIRDAGGVARVIIDAATGDIGSGRAPTEEVDVYRATGVVTVQVESGDNSAARFRFVNTSHAYYAGVITGGDFGITDVTGVVHVIRIAPACVGRSINILPGEVVINENSGNVNLRWESDADINGLFCDAGLGRIGIHVGAPLAILHIDQGDGAAAIPAMILDQADISEGFINFIGSDRGVITGATNSVESVRVELGGVVRRLALYANA